MSHAATTTCPNCKRLEAGLIALDARVAELVARNAALESENARLRKNSSSSHKPPSSDIVKPKAATPPMGHGKKRKIGGQPGHKRNERTPFPPGEIDQTREYTLDRCPDCGGPLEESSEPPRVIQQVELVQKPVVVTEHRAPKFWCAHCQTFQSAPIPAEVKAAGLVGPMLTVLVAWLKGSAHASYTTIQTFLADVLGVRLSRGQLVRAVQKVSRALEGPYAELQEALCSQKRLNVDETGHNRRGNFWRQCSTITWMFS